MKRRIIAALTALVMVVTMIPASAFAASDDALINEAEQLIKYAFDGTSAYDSMKYSKRADMKAAVAALEKVPAEKRDEVANANAILAAEQAFNNLDLKTAKVKENMAKVKPYSILSADFVSGKPIGDAYLTYSEIISGSVTGAVGENTVKIVFSTDAKKQKAELTEAIGESNYVVLNALAADIADTSVSVNKAQVVLDAVAAVDTITFEAIEDLTSADPVPAEYTAAKNAIKTSENAKNYVVYSVGYDKYVAIAEKVEKYAEVKEEMAKLYSTANKGLVGKSAKTAKTVAEINALEEKDMATFKEDLAKAEKLLADNATILADQTEYTTLKSVYKVAKENYDKFLTKDDVYTTIWNLPNAKDIAGLDFTELSKVYAVVMDIDAEVAAITTLNQKYIDVKAEAEKAFATFTPDYLAKQYAARLHDAIAKISVAPTRADVDAVNAVLEIYNEYVGLKLEGRTDKDAIAEMSDETLFGLAGYRVIASTWLDKTPILKKELAELDKGDAGRVVKATTDIKNQATADKTAAEKVADIVNINLKAITVNSIDTAKAAQDVLDKYEEEYGKLNQYAKSDYDRAIGEEGATNSKFNAVAKTIKKYKEDIAKYNADSEDYKIASQVMTNVVALNSLENTNIKNSPTVLAEAVRLVNEIENACKNETVKAIVEKEMGTVFTKDYAAKKAFVLSLVPETGAPVAVMNAIDALVKIDTTNTVTKEATDNAIAAYENAKKMYDALTPAEKARVTNSGKLDEIYSNLVTCVDKVVEAEIAKIGDYMNAPISEVQMSIINGITVMVEKTYVDYYDKTTDFDGYTTYTSAKAKMEKEIANAAKVEFDKIKPVLDQAYAYFIGNDYVVNKTSAKAIVAAYEAVDGLSDAAKDYAFTKTSGKAPIDAYSYANLVVAYDYAKALILDYAQISPIEDQYYEGSAVIPTVVVKDANGKVIDENEYTVAFSNNDKVGTAKVIVTAKADGNYVGTVSREFNILAKEPVKVTGVKADTDYGIVRVYFDRNADIEGMDVRYEVQYKKDTTDKWTVKYPTKGYEYLTLKNLTKNGKYDVRVRAYFLIDGEKTYGEFSDEITVYANRNGSKSGIMYKAVIKNLTTKNGSVTMTVNPVKYQTVPQGVTWKYSYKKYGSQYKTWSTAKTTKSTSYTFKNLKKGTRYVFRAQYTYTSAVDGKTAVNSNYSVYKNIVVK